MEPLITTNSEIMHGTPCFAGTRVEVKASEFLEQFPSVHPELVLQLLDTLRADAARAAVPA